MGNELQQLRKELADLGDVFNQKLEQLTRRINELESQQDWLQPNEPESIVPEPVDPWLATSLEATPSPESNEIAHLSSSSSKPSSNKEDSIKASSIKTKPQPKKDHITLIIDAMGQAFITFLATLFGPLSGLFDQFIGLYQHYQKQGKAPVFFMTLTGIIALVLGFGYLLQFSFNAYLGPIGKVSLGFLIAIAVTVGGVWFTKHRQSMAEYGSSIIALGVILNYLCAYFAGPYYSILPDLFGFLLLVAVTAIAYILALLFETRIVAIVTLVGGASMPLIMGNVDQSPLLYLAYLLVLSAATLQLSLRIRWPQLAWVSMVLSAGMVGWSIGNGGKALSSIEGLELFGMIAVLHGFFYLFAHYALRGLSDIAPMNKIRLGIVSANIIFFLLAFQQLVTSDLLLGSLVLLNVLPWIGLFLLPTKLFGYLRGSEESSIVQMIAILHAGILTGVGILALCSPELMGVIWCFEGLLLVYLGVTFQFTSVRIEGYTALALSLVTMSYHVVLWVINGIVPAPLLLSLTISIDWVNLIVISVLVYGTLTLMQRQSSCLTDNEQRVMPILENLFSVSLSLSFLLSVSVFWAEGLWLMAIVPMFYLIGRAQRKSLPLTELLGLAHFPLMVIPLLVSAVSVGNFHFSEQNIYGQISGAETFLSLWLIAEFYKRFYTQSVHFGFTEHLRKLFYCLIPVLFLPTVFRQHSDYFPLALWVSSAIALLLYNRLQLAVLKYELRALVVVASVAAIISCWVAKFEHWQGNASAALFAGVAFYLFIDWWGQGLRRKPVGSDKTNQRHWALKSLFTASLYYLGITLFIILYGITDDENLSMLVTLLYFAGLFFYRPVLSPLRTNLLGVYIALFVLFSLLTLSHTYLVFTHTFGQMDDLMLGLYNITAAGCLAWLVYSASAQSRGVLSISGGRLLHVCLVNVIFIAVYVSFLAQLFSTMLGPVISFSLVVHATIILFQSIKPSMKKLIWLSALFYATAAAKVLLWDMHDFSLVQKIMVFMMIGLCMLGAAFQYQKVMLRVPAKPLPPS